ncbi:DNA gyrase subunit A [Pseudoclavibacter triregionum]|nr:DNA gyrase subunit A [Pseudoclavibacter triregionum]
MTPPRSDASQPTGPLASGERIDDVDVASEMESSFLEYAYSVIYSRALPDARDGLKPVQRRILYQMSEMGLRPDRGHVKCSRVVGEVMGRLHPHGDTAIYDAMVRMAQPFVQRVATVDGHGNFGSLDDGPAAPRYTEARLATPALRMTESLDEDVVDFVPNYDNSEQQPSVLPAAWPHLLVNGAQGIAVGMATSMAPHNLGEVIDGARHLLAHPDASLDDIMALIPGPDLPSGGSIVGLSGIREAYATGRGSFRMRATASFERVSARKQGIVVTDLPYMVGPEKVIEKIKDGVQKKKLAGISDVTDLTDRTHGMRLVIEVKTGFDPAAVLEQLYRHTPLDEPFHMNNVALVDGEPKTLGLLDLLRVFLEHRISVVRRRSAFRLARKQERLHLVEGLLIAIVDIDEVIQIIRSSDDSAEASQRLQMVFNLSEAQAEYILELRLRRLTKFSRIELEAEADELRRAIAELEAILADEQLLRKTVSDELAAVSKELATPRRTLLVEGDHVVTAKAKRGAAADPEALQMADAPSIAVLSATGRILRVDLQAGEEGEAPTSIARPARRSKHDAILAEVPTSVRGEIAAITSRGRMLRLPVVSLPSAPASSVLLAAGVKARDYAGLTDAKERIVGLAPVGSETPIAMATKYGTVKRLAPLDFGKARELEIIALKPGDELVAAAPAADGDELVLVSSDSSLLRFGADKVRPQGRTAAGMAGIRLAEGATLAGFSVVPAAALEEAEVATVATSGEADDPGSAKVTPLSEFPPKGRGTGGVRAHRFARGEDRIAHALAAPGPIRANAKDGAQRQLPPTVAKRDASGIPLDASIGALGLALGEERG